MDLVCIYPEAVTSFSSFGYSIFMLMLIVGILLKSALNNRKLHLFKEFVLEV